MDFPLQQAASCPLVMVDNVAEKREQRREFVELGREIHSISSHFYCLLIGACFLHLSFVAFVCRLSGRLVCWPFL